MIPLPVLLLLTLCPAADPTCRHGAGSARVVEAEVVGGCSTLAWQEMALAWVAFRPWAVIARAECREGREA